MRVCKILQIEGTQQLPEMEPVGYEAALDTIEKNNGLMEVYIGSDDHTQVPLVGLIFDKNSYKCHGLGSDETEPMELAAKGQVGQPLNRGFWAAWFHEFGVARLLS